MENDTRNLIDKFKGMPNEAIIAELDKSRIPLEIAIENLAHDFNIGTIVRNANAFNVSRVHIIGKRKYNRRGAMVTDKYLHIDHFATVEEFIADAHARGMLVVAVDNNRPESKPLASTELKMNSIFVFGSESDGISQELLDAADQAFYIEQLGSTRSINVGCASAIAMYEAVRRLGLLPDA
ncbi:rRNA methyltransferase [Candidatus Saccharibacteria bacterium]|nr:rRNA methyltransferase [Candidatus Saccharibacteria bacterium]